MSLSLYLLLLLFLFFSHISLISQTQILNQTFLSVSRALSISRTDFLPYHKHRSSPQALIHRSSQPNFFFFTNSVDTTSFFFFAIAATSASSFVQYGFDDSFFFFFFFFVYMGLMIYIYILQATVRGVHQTAQTAKTASKPPVKWHNRTTPQVTMHRTTLCSVVCDFIIRKLHKSHRIASSLYIIIFIFLILNILLINSLITLVSVN